MNIFFNPVFRFLILSIFFCLFLFPKSGFCQEGLKPNWTKPYAKLISSKSVRITKKGNDTNIIRNYSGIPLRIRVEGNWRNKVDEILYPGDEFTLRLDSQYPIAQVSLTFPKQFYDIASKSAEEIVSLLLKGKNGNQELLKKLRDYNLTHRMANPTFFPLINFGVYLHFLNQAYYNPASLPHIFHGSTITLEYGSSEKNTPIILLESKIKYAQFQLNNLFSYTGFLDVNIGIPITPEMNLNKNKWSTRFYAVGGWQYNSNTRGIEGGDSIQIDKIYTANGNNRFIDNNAAISIENSQFSLALRMRKAKNRKYSIDAEIGTVFIRKSTVRVNTYDPVNPFFTDVFEKPNIEKNAFVNLNLNMRFSKSAKNNNPKKGYYDEESVKRWGANIFGGLMLFEQTPNANFPFRNLDNSTITLKSDRLIWSLGVGLSYSI